MLVCLIYFDFINTVGEVYCPWHKDSKADVSICSSKCLFYLHYRHFQVPKTLTSQTRLSAKTCLWKWVCLLVDKKKITYISIGSSLASHWTESWGKSEMGYWSVWRFLISCFIIDNKLTTQNQIESRAVKSASR